MKKMYGLSLVACLLLGALASSAKVSLPQFFQSGMVIQRGKPVPVWGKADAGEKVSVRINKFKTVVIADSNEKLSCRLTCHEGWRSLHVNGGRCGINQCVGR